MTMTYEDVMTVENGGPDEATHYAAMQRCVNDGTAWSLQGSFGRAMMAAIEEGRIMVGTEPRKDYWGNVIPARSMLAPGTKGTRGYVAEAFGEDWAKAMEAA